MGPELHIEKEFQNCCVDEQRNTTCAYCPYPRIFEYEGD